MNKWLTITIVRIKQCFSFILQVLNNSIQSKKGKSRAFHFTTNYIINTNYIITTNYTNLEHDKIDKDVAITNS